MYAVLIHCCLLSITVIINKCEHFFLCFQGIWISSFMNFLLKSVAHFLLDFLPYYYFVEIFFDLFCINVIDRLHVLILCSPTIWFGFLLMTSFDEKSFNLVSFIFTLRVTTIPSCIKIHFLTSS